MAQIPHATQKRVKGEAMLKCKFTESERMALSITMSDAYIEMQRAEADAKTQAAAAKGRIEAARKKVDNAAQALRDGYEERLITTEAVYHFDTGVVEVIRLDTFETVASRPMHHSERQTEIHNTEDAAAEASGPAPALAEAEALFSGEQPPEEEAPAEEAPDEPPPATDEELAARSAEHEQAEAESHGIDMDDDGTNDDGTFIPPPPIGARPRGACAYTLECGTIANLDETPRACLDGTRDCWCASAAEDEG